MPNLNITDKQFRSVLQNIQNRYIRLELLNYNYQTIDTIEGVCIAGSLTIDANSDIRRTGNISLTVTDSSFDVSPGGKVWLDKYVKVWVGIGDTFANNIEWTNCGVYIIDAPSYQFDASNNTLTLSLLDLMAKLTGIRNGYLKGAPVVLSAGENIRKAIIDILALGGFTKYVVEEAPAPSVIPNDLEFGQGATLYTLLSGLKNIYPAHEMFFDVNGTFFYKPIPTGANDPILIDDTLWENVVMSEQVSVDFQNVKNSIEVYGRTHDPAHFSTNTQIIGNTIELTIADVEKYEEGLIYGFTLTNPKTYTNIQLKINNMPSFPVTLDNGETSATIDAENGEIYYCVQWRGTYWNWLGHLQAYGIAEDTNPDSPFYIDGTVGIIRQPLYGGEYENIFSDNLAQQRAEYELWKRTNVNDTLQLSCVPVPWIDVNSLVKYTTQRNKKGNLYIIKNVNFGLSPSENMTITLMKFYPEHANIVQRSD